MGPPGTQRDRQQYGMVRAARRANGVLAAGAVVGILLTAVGMVLVIRQVEAETRSIAAFALMVPISLYIAWWIALSGLWSASTGEELEMTDNATNPELIAAVFDRAYEAEDPAVLRASVRRLDVEHEVAAQLRASVPPPARQGSDVALEQLRRSS